VRHDVNCGVVADALRQGGAARNYRASKYAAGACDIRMGK
jgi:hypothetical protein